MIDAGNGDIILCTLEGSRRSLLVPHFFDVM